MTFHWLPLTVIYLFINRDLVLKEKKKKGKLMQMIRNDHEIH